MNSENYPNEAIADVSNDLMPAEENFLTTVLQNGQTFIRKKLVYSAVNFINNPRMISTPNDQKQAFLLKKGLTQDEIELAFELCIARPSSEASLKNELDLLSSLCTNSSLIPANTFIVKLLNAAFCFTLFSGFAYGSYTFYQTKILPYFNMSRKDPYEEIYDQIRTLNEQIEDLSRKITTVHEFMQTYCRVRDDSALSLKHELSSIKSLLVNRNQFPAMPTIPKWQLDSNKQIPSVGITNTLKNGNESTNASDSTDSSKSN